MTVGFAGAAVLVGATQADPDGGRFRFDIGPQNLEGTVIGGAYPALWVTKGTEAIPAGKVILLNGNGKTGVQDRVQPLAGKAVAVRGILMERGSLRMLQLGNGKQGLAAIEGDAAAIPQAEPLGRWRLSGEICDGRCAAGAMRPGTGLAHKACANLCIAGGQPPVFVSAAPVEGESFFLMTGPAGEALSPEILRHTAEPVTLDGALTRIGNLTVLAVDATGLRRR
ncbi:hypothetical protein EOI86_13745 [Hwanghaeella grinnelliae]|uniref:Uncharacterized protein n=2 Tax=Hwanghaeella grinnelliae TaxID=2500179 RepID=A0A437QR24_9PROT|nr:hypothetical protein EOI86_13745 [Hwanghaeella grinnelliae]